MNSLKRCSLRWTSGAIRVMVYTQMVSPEHKRINIDAIKQSINLAEFAGQYTQLKQLSQRGDGEYAGACPLCGGQDRFHVKGDHFYCRQCYPRGGDVINLVQLIHGVSFLEACQMLSAGIFSFPEKQEIARPQTNVVSDEPVIDWRSAEYQESARKTMLSTQHLLLSGEGTPGQAYLRSRGLTEDTWRTYRLGNGRTFHLIRQQNMEAIFIPWFGEDGKTITAIQHRFVDPTVEKGERYTLKPGSEPILFGLQAVRPAQTLVIVEGEFNAMSLHQIGSQALSMGSESNVGNEKALSILQGLLPAYEQALVWFDNPDKGQQLASGLAEQGLFRKVLMGIAHPRMDENGPRRSRSTCVSTIKRYLRAICYAGTSWPQGRFFHWCHESAEKSDLDPARHHRLLP